MVFEQVPNEIEQAPTSICCATNCHSSRNSLKVLHFKIGKVPTQTRILSPIVILAQLQKAHMSGLNPLIPTDKIKTN
jgi:hypothetical protein